MIEVYKMLPTGQDNGICQCDLLRYFDLKPTELKAIIRKERLEGHLICSGNTGYYMPASRAEAIEFRHMMTEQALTRLETIKAFNEVLDMPEGQESIGDEK